MKDDVKMNTIMFILFSVFSFMVGAGSHSLYKDSYYLKIEANREAERKAIKDAEVIGCKARFIVGDETKLTIFNCKVPDNVMCLKKGFADDDIICFNLEDA